MLLIVKYDASRPKSLVAVGTNVPLIVERLTYCVEPYAVL